MQNCHSCQTENPDDSRICTKCGASLERTTFGRAVTPPGQGPAARGAESPSSMRTCPSCGTPSPATTQFCSACGKAFDGRALASVEYAGFGRRLGGNLIDGIILFIIAGILPVIVTSPGAGLMFLVIIFSYVVLLDANGGTWGGRILGMRLQKRETGENIGIGMSIVRFIVAGVSAAAIGIGYFWMLWDPNKQTWHDKAAGSVVVKV